jgi:hypothetical protein
VIDKGVSYGITRHGKRRHIIVRGNWTRCHIAVLWKATLPADAELPVCKSCTAAEDFYGFLAPHQQPADGEAGGELEGP